VFSQLIDSDTMEIFDRIESDPQKMLGKPVIKGTRIPVELILRKLSEGADKEDLIEAYPNITSKDIQAVLAYATKVLSFEEPVD